MFCLVKLECGLDTKPDLLEPIDPGIEINKGLKHKFWIYLIYFIFSTVHRINLICMRIRIRTGGKKWIRIQVVNIQLRFIDF